MASAGSGSFSLDVERFIKKVEGDSNQIVRMVALTALRSVVLKSPVDTGRFRGNWQVGVGSITPRMLSKLDTAGAGAIAEGSAKIGRAVAGQTIYIYNNLPYGPVLEYGLYPNPPRFGSKDRKTKAMVIKSSNGFSRQAPAGMVRVTLREISGKLRAIAAEVSKGS